MPLSSPLRRFLPLLLGFVVLVVACGQDNPMASSDALMVNQLRAGNGVPQLPRAYELDLKAQAQAQAMAGTIAQAEAALEASPPHRENLLNPYFTEMGIGAVQRGNLVYVAQVFVQR
jgi:uncharacterized protein YkwD